ncbi:MBL fold metallo-hydrolase [Mycolicibacterium komossense]|uniref:MBL fold metallo-hydrolase n=1 Tax=Mycolicibacterium komossense TaxID=1779 RepID=A0ABT3CAJ2_9MYCO|nr:MBL fold metallo-hydrolase [Mycolicibacterium komossense]MCV7226493.1 MBL fold metallo-hydrolase [Mycolicibacterium komossense]
MSNNQLTSDLDVDSDDELPSHVVRIPLPLPLRDLREVNVYAILGEDGVTLVDSGWADDASETVLVEALARLGFAPHDVARVVVTHHHWDHYSRAIDWQRRYGTTVMIGREERHSIEAFDERTCTYPVQAQQLIAAGATELAETIAAFPLETYERNVPYGPADVWLEDGIHIDCGGVDPVARSTPGHTRGHIVYEDRRSRLAFTGDHILPRITPSIALERQPEELPLRSYLASLKLFLDLPDATMLPAHGAVTESVKARAEQLLEHHRDRLEQARELVAAGNSTAYQVARQMRWTRHERTIDELGAVHGMTAILEVLAHLELLVTQGALERTGSGTVNDYVVSQKGH